MPVTNYGYSAAIRAIVENGKPFTVPEVATTVGCSRAQVRRIANLYPLTKRRPPVGNPSGSGQRVIYQLDLADLALEAT